MNQVMPWLIQQAVALHVQQQDVPDASFKLWPVEASKGAMHVDIVFIALLVMSLVFVVTLFTLLLTFMIRYRAGSKADRSGQIRKTWKWELSWIVATGVVFLAVFLWSSFGFFKLHSPPSDAAVYYVTGRQWMWEIEDPSGRREMNAMHVPVNQPVKVVLTSKDVIHSFYVPAFRVKQDAVPGRYTSIWFTPTRVGAYHLFCAEYCGTGHSKMLGTVYVMTPDKYQQWLEGNPVPPTAQPLVKLGRNSFRQLGCYQCHEPGSAVRAPSLEGLYGSKVTLSDGTQVTADEQYIRESLLDPAAKVVQGYAPIMPTYKGLLDEQQVAQIVQAIRALKDSHAENDQ